MSTGHGPIIKYTCFNDCRQEGCPGHEIREVFHRTSDVIIFEIDGKREYYFDENCFRAMLEADKAYKEKEKQQ